MARAADEPRLADRVIRARAVYSMADGRAVYRSLAVRDEWIVAASADPHGLDGLISPGTQVIDAPNLTLLPALFDTHLHLLEAVRNFDLVPADRAHSIAELVDLIRQRAAQTPAGQWIQTTNAWNESALAEHRLPTAAELDAATTAHPVLVRRGGHNGVANSLALRLADISSGTPVHMVDATAALPMVPLLVCWRAEPSMPSPATSRRRYSTSRCGTCAMLARCLLVWASARSVTR
jgi:predicted amidohydrolase YtcJ